MWTDNSCDTELVLQLLPDGSDEEVEQTDHGEADQDIERPLDHGAVHAEAGEQSSGTRPAALGRVDAAGVGQSRGGGDGGFDLIHRSRDGDEAKREEKR